jgi:multidrug efflux pump subunit AcrA (membrane-fusion protein)
MNTRCLRSYSRLLVALLLTLLTLSGCSLRTAGRSNSGQQLDETTPTPIPTAVAVGKPTYVVARGDVSKQLILNGRMVPVNQADLYFKVSGRVRSVAAKSDDMVKAGQLLAELEMDATERDLAGSRLDLERAQARLKAAQTELQQNIQRAQANLDIAGENLAIARVQGPGPRKTQAEVGLTRAQQARDRAQAAYDAIAWRNDRGASAEGAALEQATLSFTDAKAAYDLAMQGIAAFDHQVAIARRQVDLAQIALVSLKQGVDPLLENDVKRAQFAVDKLLAAVADNQIVAPFDGQAEIAFTLSPGAAVDAYKYVATVADPSGLEVSSDAGNTNLDQIKEGMPAIVSLLSAPGVDVLGHIRRMPPIGAVAVTTPDKTMRFTLDDKTPSGFGKGELVRITLTLEQKKDMLWLPPTAIRTFEGRKFVVVQDNAAQRRVDVKIGIDSADRVEILSGLTEGQIVVGQ